jgi:RES domain-containing protein
MPRVEPPLPAMVELQHQTLAAGMPLWRLGSSRRPAGVFREDIPDVDDTGLKGGRFDPTAACLYPYVYVAMDPVTTLAESILRDAPYQAGGRLLPRSKYAHKVMMCLESTRPLRLVRLIDAEDLAAARNDTWLVHADSPDYPVTRRWAHWFRDCSPKADGMIWPSKRQPGGQVTLLFGDAYRSGTAVGPSPFGTRPLGTPEGERWLAGLLAPLLTFLTSDEDDSTWA